MNALIPETYFDFNTILPCSTTDQSVSRLPCVCCGEPVFQDNLCKSCYDQMKEND